MSDAKESGNDLLVVVLSIAVLMVCVYFQQSQQWNRDLKSRDQKIGDFGQKLPSMNRAWPRPGTPSAATRHHPGRPPRS